MTTMGFGVLFGLLLAVSGWWLYSRWSELRDAQARRREAELLYIFEAKMQRPASIASSTTTAPAAPGDFYPTLPGHR
jgi:hypothetical protein